MSPDTEFYLKIAVVFIVSGLIIKYMNYKQRLKEEEAEKQFQRVLQMIDLRNKIYVPKEKQ